MPNNNPNYQVIIQQTADPSAKTPTGISIVANLPENFAFDSTSSYETPYAQGIFGAGANAAAAFTGTRLTTQAQTARIWQGATDSDLMLDFEFFAENDPDADVMQKTLNMLRLTAPTIDPQTGMLRSPGPQLVLNDAGQLSTNLVTSTGNSLKQVGNAAASLVGFGNKVQQKNMNGANANLSATGVSNTPPQPDAAGTADFWKRQVRNQISIKIGRYAFFDSVVIMNVQKTYSHNLDALTGQPLHAKVSIRFAPLFLLTQDDIVNIFRAR
jgi:hypothetical protein